MIMLEEKGLPYESKLLEFSKGDHKSEQVLALNPRGQFPTFKDGDVVINESGGICIYLETQYPEKKLLPADAPSKAKVLQRFFETFVLDQKVSDYGRPKSTNKDDPDEEKHIADVKAEMDLWESYLGKQKYAATDEFTLADVMLAPAVLVMMRYGATFKDYPNVKKYADMIKEHPSVVKTEPPHYKEGPPTQSFMNII